MFVVDRRDESEGLKNEFRPGDLEIGTGRYL